MLPTDSFSIKPVNFHLIHYVFSWLGAFAICLGSFSFGGILAYPTRALLEWRNETNIELKLDNNEGSLFASIFWMVGLFFAPIGGVLSGTE